jgi:hypothetical protein
MRAGLIGAIAAGGIMHTAAGQTGSMSVMLLHNGRISPSTQRQTQEA